MLINPKIKKNLTIIALVSALICSVSFYYVFKSYKIITYKSGLTSLISDIFEKSASKKFAGTISELKTLSGPQEDKYLGEMLIPEIKIQLLSPKSPYVSIIDPAEYEGEIKALRRELQERKVSGDVIADVIKVKTSKAKKAPDYKAELSWSWSDEEKGYLQLVFKISAVDFIEAKTIITHPAYEKQYLSRKHFFTTLGYISGVTLAASVLILLGIIITFKLRARKAYTTLPSLKEKVSEFADAGQFLAALNEIEKYLTYLPNNSEVLALKNQLLVKTKGNPAKAEEAYNKLQFIKGKLQGRGMDKIDEKDLEDLRKISDFIEIEGVGAIIGRIEGQLHSKIAIIHITSAQSHAKALLENGRPDEAIREIEKAQDDPALNEYNANLAAVDNNDKLALPAPDSLKSMHKKLEEIIRSSQDDFAQAKDLLNRGEVARAEELLKKASEINHNLAGAQELLSNLEKSRKAEKLFLNPEKIGKKVFIFKKDVITIFRRDLKEPDIELNVKTVSRDAHLKIAVVGDDVLAEDQNSSTGTKIGGYKLKDGGRLKINDGDILDFNGEYRMTVHICRGRRDYAAPTVLGATSISAYPRNESTDSKNISAVAFEGEDDRNFIMLLESVPVDFKSIGIVYEKAGNCQVYIKDNVLLLQTPENCQVLYPNLEIEYHGTRYRAETI